MAKGLVTDTYLTDIANAIRAKNGSTTPYKLSEMSAAIENISTKVKPNYVSFYNCKDSTIDLSWLDTSNIKSMSYMFNHCNKVRRLDLSKFNTSNVYSFEFMFSSCQSLESIDLSMLDGSSITATSLMFNYCTNLEKIDISNWDFTNKVELNNAADMFNYCGSNLSSPTTVYVKNEAMQQWVLSTENVPSNWSTANVIIKNQ